MASIADAPVAGAARWRSFASAMRRRIDDWLDAERAQVPLWSPVAFGLGVTLYFMLPWEGQRLAAVVAALGVTGSGTIIRGTAGRMLA